MPVGSNGFFMAGNDKHLGPLLQRAGQLREEMGHPFIDGAHFIVAILEQPDKYSSASRLTHEGFDRATVYEQVKEHLRPKTDIGAASRMPLVAEPLTFSAKRMFALALVEAERRSGVPRMTEDDLIEGLSQSVNTFYELYAK